MWLVVWVVLAVLVGVLASSRGRSGFGYTLASLAFSPLIGFIFVIATENLAAKRDREALEPSATTHVRCPKCAEFVLPQAVICKHCGSELTPQPVDKVALDRRLNAKEDAANLRIGIGFIVVLFAVAWLLSKCVGS